VYHRDDTALRCHYCGHREPVPDVCPACRSRRIRHFGAGTERVEAEVRALFPDSRVARLDLDVAVRRDAVRGILSDFARGTIDVLVGTQMVGKGLDVPGVTLVGVVAADTSLGFPDFRAGERTFSLVTQVSGRAGRGPAPGLVVVQTYSPDHYTLLLARHHDYLGFFEQELDQRRELGYPPFARLALARLQGNSESRTEDLARRLAEMGADLLSDAPAGSVDILGPAPAPVAKVKGKYRFQILFKAARVGPLHQFLRRWLSAVRPALAGSGVALSLDVDPNQMM